MASSTPTSRNDVAKSHQGFDLVSGMLKNIVRRPPLAKDYHCRTAELEDGFSHQVNNGQAKRWFQARPSARYPSYDDAAALPERDPGWGVIARAGFCANILIDTRRPQSRRQFRVQQKMIEPQASVSFKAMPHIMPEGIDPLPVV
jgi:hypothetical protein